MSLLHNVLTSDSTSVAPIPHSCIWTYITARSASGVSRETTQEMGSVERVYLAFVAQFSMREIVREWGEKNTENLRFHMNS